MELNETKNVRMKGTKSLIDGVSRKPQLKQARDFFVRTLRFDDRNIYTSYVNVYPNSTSVRITARRALLVLRVLPPLSIFETCTT